MKHLKTFEQHQLNEGILGGVRKFATGYESSDERDDKILSISTQLNEIEAEVNKSPEGWSFNRDALEQSAKDNNYRGELRVQKGGRNTNITYVVWDNKATGFQDIAGVASGTVQINTTSI